MTDIDNLVKLGGNDVHEDKSLRSYQFMKYFETNQAWTQNNGLPGGQILRFTIPELPYTVPAEATLDIIGYPVILYNNTITPYAPPAQAAGGFVTANGALIPTIAAVAANGPTQTYPYYIAFQNNFPIVDGATFTANGVALQSKQQYVTKDIQVRNFLEYSNSKIKTGIEDCLFFPDDGAGGFDINTVYQPLTATNAGGPPPTTSTVTIPTATAPLNAGAISTNSFFSGSYLTNPNLNTGFAKRLVYAAVPSVSYSGGNALSILYGPYVNAFGSPAIGGAVPPILASSPTTYHIKKRLSDLVDVFADYDRVWINTPFELTLQYNQNPNQLYYCSNALPANTSLSFKITNLYINMPILVVDPLVDRMLSQKVLENEVNKIQYLSYQTQLSPFPTASGSYNWSFTCQTSRPYAVFIQFQAPSQLSNPGYRFNSFTGTNVLGIAAPPGYLTTVSGGVPDVTQGETNPLGVQLTNILLQVNGATYPASGGYLTNQYQNNLNYETYLQLTNNVRNHEDGPALTYNTFNNVYGYYVFDLRFHDWTESPTNPTFTLNAIFSGATTFNVFATIISEAAFNLTLGSGKMTVALA